jgi:predicted dinucleotide-binding enzyme
MTIISIIGSGNMASAIGTRAAKHGHTIELMSRNTVKAQALADQIGNRATVGTFGATHHQPVQRRRQRTRDYRGQLGVPADRRRRPERTHVVKAFNSIFRGVLAEDKPVDVFFAGDSSEAKARVAAFLESLDMRPLDAGGLEMAYVLEWPGILLAGLARNGVGFDIALGAKAL